MQQLVKETPVHIYQTPRLHIQEEYSWVYFKIMCISDLGVHERILLKQTTDKLDWTGMDWIHLAQNRELRQADVNTPVNVRIP